jgi:hypothetical protein
MEREKKISWYNKISVTDILKAKEKKITMKKNWICERRIN